MWWVYLRMRFPCDSICGITFSKGPWKCIFKIVCKHKVNRTILLTHSRHTNMEKLQTDKVIGCLCLFVISIFKTTDTKELNTIMQSLVTMNDKILYDRMKWECMVFPLKFMQKKMCFYWVGCFTRVFSELEISIKCWLFSEIQKENSEIQKKIRSHKGLKIVRYFSNEIYQYKTFTRLGNTHQFKSLTYQKILCLNL